MPRRQPLGVHVARVTNGTRLAQLTIRYKRMQLIMPADSYRFILCSMSHTWFIRENIKDESNKSDHNHALCTRLG